MEKVFGKTVLRHPDTRETLAIVTWPTKHDEPEPGGAQVVATFSEGHGIVASSNVLVMPVNVTEGVAVALLGALADMGCPWALFAFAVVRELRPPTTMEPLHGNEA